MIISSILMLFVVLTLVVAGTSTQSLTLREAGLKKGMYIGSQFRYDVVFQSDVDTNYTKVHGNQFSLSTVGNQCKWAATHQSRNSYNLTRCIQSFEYAKQKHQEFRGHNLCWGNNNPEWLLDGNWTQTDLQTILEDHVSSVMKGLESHGDVYAWVRFLFHVSLCA